MTISVWGKKMFASTKFWALINGGCTSEYMWHFRRTGLGPIVFTFDSQKAVFFSFFKCYFIELQQKKYVCTVH